MSHEAERKRIAVLGANGQVGSSVVKRLSRSTKHDLIAVCRNPLAASAIASLPRCEIRTGNAADAGDAVRLYGDCDAVVNCALAAGAPRPARRINAEIIQNVRKAAGAGHIRSFVHLSTVAVYGALYHPDLGGSFARPRAGDAYGRDKLFAERVMRRTFRGGGVDWFILRVGHVYGPEQGHSADFLGRIRSGFRLPFEGTGPSNAVHVDRLGIAIGQLCADPGISPGIMNACESESSWGDVLDLHADAAGLHRVARMSAAESTAVLQAALGALARPTLTRLIREVGIATSKVPASMAQLPGLRDLGYGLLSHLSEGANALAKKRYVAWQARVQSGVGTPQAFGPDSWHFLSSGVPGPNVFEVLGERSSFPSASIAEDLAEWARGVLPPAWCGHLT